MQTAIGTAGPSAGKIKLFTGPGTRQWPRFDISYLPGVADVVSNSGSRIKIVNISRGGALIHTRQPLISRTRIHMDILFAEDKIPLTGLILRSSILRSKGATCCQAAVAFDSPLQMLGSRKESATRDQGMFTVELLPFGTQVSGSRWQSTAVRVSDEPSAMTALFLACARDISNAAVEALPRLNDW